MEDEKRKFDLFVHGNIISKGYLASYEMPAANIYFHVPYESVDLKQGIIVEGDMVVDNLYTVNKIIGCSGDACGRGLGMINQELNGTDNNKA